MKLKANNNFATTKFLEDICKITKGKQLNLSSSQKGNYPIINGGVEPSGYCDKFNNIENTITINQGGSAGFVCFQKQKFWASAHCFVLQEIQPYIIPKFLYYYLKNSEKYLYKLALQTSSTIPGIRVNDLKKVKIIFPCLEIQKKIVKMLDKFEYYLFDLLSGLPLEIIFRNKQYKYYLHKLFKFEK